MINDLKLGFKVLKYAHAVKSTLVLGGIMVLIGIALCILNVAVENSFPGGYFIMITALFLLQLLYSVNMSNLVQASPMKKRLQTSVPAVIGTFCMLMGYLLTVLTEGIVAYFGPEEINYICGQILFTMVVMGVIMLYTGICYKYFVVATVMFILVFAICYSYLISSRGWFISFAGDGWGMFALTAAAGLAFILICGVLQYLLSLAVYKAPMSKRTQAASLRRQL